MMLTFLLSGDSLSNLLYRAVRFTNFKAIVDFSVLSIILADLSGNTWLPERVQKVMVCDWWISIRLVCFYVSKLIACDHPVLGYNQLVCFKDFSNISYSCHLQE